MAMQSISSEKSSRWWDLHLRCRQLLLSLPSADTQTSVAPAFHLELPPRRHHRLTIQKTLSNALQETELVRCLALLKTADEDFRRHLTHTYSAQVRETRSLEQFDGMRDIDFQKGLAKAYTNYYKQSEERLLNNMIAAIESRAEARRFSSPDDVDSNVSEISLRIFTMR
jgi:hypothetical protein